MLLSTEYVKRTMKTVKRLLAKDGCMLKSRERAHKGSLPPGCKPKLDVTGDCNTEHVTQYQQLIGILR